MKVLFDTNVYVSESLVGGLAQRIVDATLGGRWRVYVNAHILGEIERVLSQKFGFSAQFAALARQRAGRRSDLVVTPQSRHEVPDDPKEDRKSTRLNSS